MGRARQKSSARLTVPSRASRGTFSRPLSAQLAIRIVRAPESSRRRSISRKEFRCRRGKPRPAKPRLETSARCLLQTPKDSKQTLPARVLTAADNEPDRMKAIRRLISPRFRNRRNTVILCPPLDPRTLEHVLDMLLIDVESPLDANRLSLTLDVARPY